MSTVAHPEQLALFDFSEAPDDRSLESDGKAGNGNGFNDPAFASNKAVPIHRWVPWIAGFAKDFVADVLTRYLPQSGTVLDPFAGVGTTLVESVLGGHNAIGFEINPYAALASRVKATAHNISVEDFYQTIDRFREFYQTCISTQYIPKSASPPGFKTRSAFYSPDVLRKVLIAQDFIAEISHETMRDLFRLAFAATMVRYSNYSYEPSLGRRVSAGKEEILDFPVGTTLLKKLSLMAKDILWFQSHIPSPPASVQVLNDSFFNYRKHLSPESVDLVITSPPYLNNYHYNRNTRPQLYWLGFASEAKDLKPLEHANFGKYWQTVRGGERLDLEFALRNSDLEERLDNLRQQTPDKGVYGGFGWANYAAAYFNDCHHFAEGLQHALKPGGTALVVIGNSILQGISIPTDQYFAEIAETVGLNLIGIDIPRATRVGNSIIQSDVRVAKAKDSQRLYEAIVELRKL